MRFTSVQHILLGGILFFASYLEQSQSLDYQLKTGQNSSESFLIVPTLRLENAASDALRHASLKRCRMHSHAERGNDVLFTIYTVPP